MSKTVKILCTLLVLLIFVCSWLWHNASTLPTISSEPKGISISNCEEPRDENAITVCPELYCQKYLWDNEYINENSYLQTTGVSASTHSSISIIQGSIEIENVTDSENLFYYCRMDKDKVLEAETMTKKAWFKRLHAGDFEI